MSTEQQLLEKAARAIRSHQASRSDDQERLARWWDQGSTSPEDRAVCIRQATAGIDAVRPDIAAEALREAADAFPWSADVPKWLRDRADALSTPSEPADDPRAQAWDEGYRDGCEDMFQNDGAYPPVNPYRTPSTSTPATGQAEEEA